MSSKNRGNKLQILELNEVKNKDNNIVIIEEKSHSLTNEKNKA